MNIKRILAILALIAIAVLLVLLIVLAFMGAKREWLLALLFMIMIVPTVIYIFIWFMGLGKD